MKPLEIKGARTRLGFTQQLVAEKLGISVHSYRKKESGEVKFTDDEKICLGEVLELNLDQLDDYLFDGKLRPFICTEKVQSGVNG